MESQSTELSRESGAANSRTQLWSRNGRKIACNPCRRRKLACDHSHPVCRRCSRRGTAGEECAYDASLGDSPGRSLRSGKRRSETDSRTDVAKHPPSGQPSADHERRHAGLSEAANVPSLSDGILSHTNQSPNILQVQSTPDERHSLVPADHQLKTALEVLECVPGRATSSLLISRNQSPVDAWLFPAVKHLSQSFFDMLETHRDKARPGRPSPLQDMALILCNNAERSLIEEHSDAQSWLSSFSGSNFRWEALGILFTYWTTGTLRRFDDDDTEEQLSTAGENDGKAGRYLQCINSCLELCGRIRPGNTLILYLLIKRTHLVSVHHGEAS